MDDAAQDSPTPHVSPRIAGLHSLEDTPRRTEERRLAAAMREVI